MPKRNVFMKLLSLLITLFSLSVLLAACSGSGNGVSPATYSVSGRVSGDISQSVNIAVSGAVSANVPTDADGNYSVSGLPNGSYTITPSKAGYTFTQANRSVVISGADLSGNDFTAATALYTVSGSVSGAVTAGVTITVSGTTEGGSPFTTSITTTGGSYSVPNVPNGDYTVTPANPGHSFAPVSIAVTINAGNAAIAAFTSTIDNSLKFILSGTVSGDIQAGVTINVSGPASGSAATVADGTYTVSNLPNGTYTVSAAKPGYTFSADLSATIDGADSSGNDFTATVALVFTADGGAGTAGTGGDGGEFYAESYGSIKVLKSGTVDASFPAPSDSRNFGVEHIIVTTDTTVSTVDSLGALCQAPGGDDRRLYIGNGTGICDDGDTLVTGLTIAVGATLVLVDQGSGYGTLQLDNDLVINGTLTTDLSDSNGLYIEANLIEVGINGKITASATEPDYSGGEIRLGDGQDLTQTIINRGTIEAKGDGSGSGGYIYFEPSDLVVNYGTIDVSGGSAGGSGGEFDAFVDHGDFYSSGTVRMNGGDGPDGGDTEYESGNWDGYSCRIEAAYVDNTRGRNGDIIISGTWEARGGDGADGYGGSGGYMYFQTGAMGSVTVNASMSVKGGNGTGEFSSGGSAGEIDFASVNGDFIVPTPGKIRIAGSYDLRGGNGDRDGGSGGYLYIYSNGVNSSDVGSDVEFVGFPLIFMNGGEGGENGGSASGSAFGLYTYSNSELIPAKSILNEADVLAKGGNATLEGGTGGTGGYVDIQTGNPGDAATVLSNSGNIDVSGGDGDAGGSAEAIYLQAQHVNNSGNLTANGGNGTTAEGGSGGSGGNITLTSEDVETPTNNTGTLSVTGGAPDGADGTITIDGFGGGVD